MRESFIIYKSFIDAGAEIDSKTARLSFYEAIFHFALTGEESELSGISKAMFMLVKPQLEANQRRFENGKKPKQNVSKPEAKPKQNVSKPEANNNVNDNVNCIMSNVNAPNAKKNYFEVSFLNLQMDNVKIFADEYEKLVKEFSEEITNKAITFLSEYKIEKGYKTKSDYLTIRRWVIDAVLGKEKNVPAKKESEREQTIGGVKLSEYQKLADSQV